MEQKMLEVLTRTHEIYELYDAYGHEELAAGMAHDLLAQVSLVEKVTGKRVELVDDGHCGKFVFATVQKGENNGLQK